VARLGVDEVPGADVVVSTIPAAAQDQWVLEVASRASVVFDVVYDPWPTPLAAGVADGQTLVGGLDLLVHQAVLQVELMTGAATPLAAMRAAGERALAARGSKD
jgi:shikimate dehydrogenase